ncbi:MAG: hypothetical protein O7G85_00465 [Planctomycetota bacterium]|nr:hypothetical protein [Planctomycetota bacterium]
MSTSVHPGLRPITRVAIALLLLSPLVLAAPRIWGRFGPTAGLDNESGHPRLTIASTRPILGYAIVAHHIGKLDLYLDSVDRIAALGANSLTIVTPMFQKYVDSSEIKYLDHKCPTEQQLKAIFSRAKSHGLMTTIQPIVLIEKPGKKDWRGVIEPKDWETWWASYHELIDRFLRVAIESDVDMFVMGSELNTTEENLDQWQEIVDKIRSNFDGQITYSANWDRYDKTQIWTKVDVISISSYFELERNNPGAPKKDLVFAWGPIRRKLLQFANDWDMPMLLSELGYPSLPWANAHPWNYVADGINADHEMQARCYEAFFEAWAETIADLEGPAAGFTCYHWDPYHRGRSKDTGYGIEGKPSKRVIMEGFERIKELASDPDRPASTQPQTMPTTAPAR